MRLEKLRAMEMLLDARWNEELKCFVTQMYNPATRSVQTTLLDEDGQLLTEEELTSVQTNMALFSRSTLRM